MRPIMRRDRSSRYVTSARDVDAVVHRNSQRKHRLRHNSSSNRSLLSSRGTAVRKNVKHDKLCRSSAGKKAHDRSNSSHAVNRSRLSVAPVRLRRNDPRAR